MMIFPNLLSNTFFCSVVKSTPDKTTGDPLRAATGPAARASISCSPFAI